MFELQGSCGVLILAIAGIFQNEWFEHHTNTEKQMISHHLP